jgi:uncharacterized membrane protein
MDLSAGMAYYILVRALIAPHGRDSTLATAIGGDFKGKISPLLYAAVVPLAFANAWVAFGIYMLVAAMWVVPDRCIERRLTQ